MENTNKHSPSSAKTPLSIRDVVEVLMLTIAAIRDDDLDEARECVALAGRMLDVDRHVLTKE